MEQINTDQQKDLLLAYDESFDPANLIDHEEVKREHEKWVEMVLKKE